METTTKDIRFWGRVLSNLKKHEDQRYVTELIWNVTKTIEKLKKGS